MTIPYLGERLLDALVGLLVRLHLAGFFWGDCSLSNALFRRDAGALQAYIIDVETSERYRTLTDGQRQIDLDIATENVAGGLLDLQAGGRLVADIDPWEIAADLEARYAVAVGRAHRDRGVRPPTSCGGCEERVRRLHDLGFDVGEMEVVADEDGNRLRFVPRVVESGYHQERLFALTGLWAGENQARRLLDDIRGFGAELQARTGATPPENIVAVRWLDQRFEPIIALDPAVDARQAAGGRDLPPAARAPLVPECEAEGSRRAAGGGGRRYIADVLAPAPAEHLRLERADRRAVPPRPVPAGVTPASRRGVMRSGTPVRSAGSGRWPARRGSSPAISSRSGRAGRRRRRWRRR